MIAWLRIFIYIFSRIENSRAYIYIYIFFIDTHFFEYCPFIEREIKISLGRNAYLLIRSFPIGRKGMT